MSVAGFLFRYLNGLLTYVRRHISVNKMCLVRREIKNALLPCNIDFLVSDFRWLWSCLDICAIAIYRQANQYGAHFD